MHWVDYVYIFPNKFIWKTFIIYFSFLSITCPTLPVEDGLIDKLV